MSDIISFPQPAKLMSLNDRMHWSKRAKLTALWREAGWAAALEHHVRGLGPSTVMFTFPVSSMSRRRDPSNLLPTAKAAIDGLVDAGVWPDDNSEWVTVLEPCVQVGGEVLVLIRPR